MLVVLSKHLLRAFLFIVITSCGNRLSDYNGVACGSNCPEIEGGGVKLCAKNDFRDEYIALYETEGSFQTFDIRGSIERCSEKTASCIQSPFVLATPPMGLTNVPQRWIVEDYSFVLKDTKEAGYIIESEDMHNEYGVILNEVGDVIAMHMKHKTFKDKDIYFLCAGGLNVMEINQLTND